MLKKSVSVLLVLIMIVSVFIPLTVSAEDTQSSDKNTAETENICAAEIPEVEEPVLDEDSALIPDLSDIGNGIVDSPASDNAFNLKADKADIADTGSIVTNSDKANMLSDSLFHNAKYYNNDLAEVCANLCVDVSNDISEYFPAGQSEKYVAEFDSNAFNLCIGYKTINQSGSAKNLITICFRGTGSFYEGALDFLKDSYHWPFLEDDALNGPWKLQAFATEKLLDFYSDHPSVTNHPFVFLITGYSLGGAAANLMGAKLTNQEGGDSSDKVFVYTFGAIKAIASSANLYDGYSNIFNIYNYYDSWSPNGNHAFLDVSDPYYKFGITYFCYFDYDHDPTSLNSHDMGNYRTAVETNSVNVIEDRKAGILDGDKWWKLSFHFLFLYGTGDIGNETDISLNKYNKEIKWIDIDDGITRIGPVFQNCANLDTIYIPGSVTSIADNSFLNCNYINEIRYYGTHDQWDAIDVDYNNGNQALQRATLYCLGDERPTTPTESEWPETVVDHGKCGDNVRYTLYKDGLLEISGLGDMYHYDNINRAPWYSNRSQINKVNIGDSVTSIGLCAFKSCAELTSVVIPDSVTSIGGEAFYSCTSLASIVIPDSVTSIGGEAFQYTAWYSNQPNGLVYAGKCAYRIKGIRPLRVVIKDGTVGIAAGAFSECTDLTSVVIPDSVTTINGSAFYKCTRLTSIVIPDSVTSIGYAVFQKCTRLTSIVIPDSVTSIGSYAFSGCTSLKSIVIPDSVTSIGSFAFYNCTGLTSIVIPDSVTSIGDDAFGYYYDNNLYRINDFTIYGYQGSSAEEYANKNSIKFVDITSVDPTGSPTQAPTTAPTQKPTEHPTQPPTQAPTQAPTKKSTEQPTQEPTQAGLQFLLGDVDGDGEVSIIDATLIQRFDVGISVPVSEDDILMCGDVDNDGDVGILDATLIQRYNVGLTIPYPIGELIS